MMKLATTNIFCVLGKPGSGKLSIMHNMLARKDFVMQYSVDRLVFGTTKVLTKSEEEEERFRYMPLSSYQHINDAEPERLIDSKSVDDIVSNEIYYEFILKDYITMSKNYIGIASVSQYEELKRWSERVKAKDKSTVINVYPILVVASIFERSNRLLSKCNTELDVYKMCAELLLETYEYSDCKVKDNSEIINGENACILDNNCSNKENIDALGDILQNFIVKKIEEQGDI